MWTTADWNVVLAPVVLVMLLALLSFLLGGAASAKDAESADSTGAVKKDKPEEGAVPVRGVKIADTGSDMAAFAGSAPHLQPNWDAEDAEGAACRSAATKTAPNAATSAASEEERAKAAAKTDAAFAILMGAGGLYGGKAGAKPVKAGVASGLAENQMQLPLAGAEGSKLADRPSAPAAPAQVQGHAADVNALLAAAAADDVDADPDMAGWDESPSPYGGSSQTES